MCQNKKDRCMFHANLSKLLVGGAFYWQQVRCMLPEETIPTLMQ